MYDDMQPDNNQIGSDFDRGGDREGAMAKADLYKLANYSLKLFKKLQDEDQLEGWVQAKITKSADYIASVYHYLEYEMKVSEYGEQLNNAEMMSESRKQEIKTKLVEAKEKIKALKMAQAEKQKKSEKPKKVEEGMFGGEQKACEACGGSGQMMTPERAIPEELKAKVEKYNRRAKAFTAASKRIDRNKNGIPDDEEVSEEQGELKKTGDSKKTPTGTLTKTDTGVVHKNTSYADGGDDEVNPKSGKGKKSHAKSQSAAEKKSQAPKLKQSPKSAKTWGMKDSEKFDNRDKEVSEVYGQGVYEGKKKKEKAVVEEPNEGNEFSGELAKAKASGAKQFKVDGKSYPVKEALKGGQKKLDVDKDGDIEADDLADLRAKKDKKVDEAKGKKPDFLDMDKDGDKKEPMKKAVADKKAGPKKGVNPFAKKVDETTVWKNKAASLRESLASFSTNADMSEDSALEEMMAMAAELDAEGLAEASRDPAKLDEFLQNMFAVEEEQVDEGQMKDMMHKDAERLSREKFLDKYPGDGYFWDNINDEEDSKDSKEASLNESADFDRMKQFLTRLNG